MGDCLYYCLALTNVACGSGRRGVYFCTWRLWFDANKSIVTLLSPVPMYWRRVLFNIFGFSLKSFLDLELEGSATIQFSHILRKEFLFAKGRGPQMLHFIISLIYVVYNKAANLRPVGQQF